MSSGSGEAEKARKQGIFRKKGWESWKTVDLKVAFKKGGNIVKVVAVGDGPNLDALAVNK